MAEPVFWYANCVRAWFRGDFHEKLADLYLYDETTRSVERRHSNGVIVFECVTRESTNPFRSSATIYVVGNDEAVVDTATRELLGQLEAICEKEPDERLLNVGMALVKATEKYYTELVESP